MINKLSIICVAAAMVATARADVKPNALFSDNAVLQQGKDVPVWGTAKEGETVAVEIDGQSVETVAKDHRWMVHLKDLKPGGPFTMTIKGENTITVRNILVGEVWLCSGQSNMARIIVPPATVQPRQPYWEETAAEANHPEIRHFHVGGGPTDEPVSETVGKWEICTPQTAREFTAVGYFFARDLLKARNVPIGLINASVGATGAACWVSREGLSSTPELNRILESQEKARKEYPAVLEKYNATRPNPAVDNTSTPDPTETGKVAVVQKSSAPRDPFTDSYRPSGYYNGKIAPLQPYALRGVLWYQGENNSGHAREYRTLFRTLIDGWRRLGDKRTCRSCLCNFPDIRKPRLRCERSS